MAVIPTLVTGEAIFDNISPAFSGAIAHIILQDTTLADAAAVGIAHLDIPNISFQPGREPLAFAFPSVRLDPSKRYEVRVHIDLDGDGRVGPGDHITTESYPVPIAGGRAHLKLRLRCI